MRRDYAITRTRGFTLIEVAVVIFIGGMILTGVVAFLNTLVINRQIDATRAKQEAIRSALIGFIARQGRMPCPASPTIPDFPVPPAAPDPMNGVEATTPGICDGIPSSGAAPNVVVTGAVPWVSLGLPSDVALDAYANRFTYQVNRASTATGVGVGMTGIITLHRAGPAMPGVVPPGNQINECTPPGEAINPCAAVTAIISHGKDAWGAFSRSGLQIRFSPAELLPPHITGNDARENANGDFRFVTKDFSGVESDPFDDIVMTLTTNDLLSSLIIGGTLKDPRAGAASTFQLVQGAVIASAVSARTQVPVPPNPVGPPWWWSYPLPATPPYPLPLPPAPSGFLLSVAQMTDPWGTQIRYTQVTATITAGTPPTAVAFIALSAGPDRILDTPDDITFRPTVAQLQAILGMSGW